MGEYYIVITDAGVALEAAAHAAGEPVALTAFGVCDGGAAFTPDPAQTALTNEVYRGDISSLSVSKDDSSVLVAQCIVPASSGGYTIRGLGIYAGDTLYAVGNYPDQPKPAPDSGYAASLEILAQLAVSDTADVTLNVTDGAWLTKEEGDQLYVPLARKVNGHALTTDINVTSQDIFNGQAVSLGSEVDLNTITTPGLYYQPANAQAQSGANYPEPNAGSLEVYKHAGITQIYRIYNNSRCYWRALYSGNWSNWSKVYDTNNRPSAADIGALPIGGGTLDGGLTVPNIQVGKAGSAALHIGDNDSGLRSSVDGQVDLWANNAQAGYWKNSEFSFNGTLVSRIANGLRIAYGDYGFIIRNDGGSTYFMLTNAKDSMGGYNTLRPLYINNSTGDVTLGKVNFANWTNIDNRYYTKTLADQRFQPKGNYTPTGTAYTKAESDARYVQNMQRGAAVSPPKQNEYGPAEAPAGCVVTRAWHDSDTDYGVFFTYRPLQIYINGAWRTISG